MQTYADQQCIAEIAVTLPPAKDPTGTFDIDLRRVSRLTRTNVVECIGEIAVTL